MVSCVPEGKKTKFGCQMSFADYDDIIREMTSTLQCNFNLFLPQIRYVLKNSSLSVPPQTVIIPILCSIIIFPIVAASAICLLRYYNQRARAKDRFR